MSKHKRPIRSATDRAMAKLKAKNPGMFGNIKRVNANSGSETIASDKNDRKR